MLLFLVARRPATFEELHRTNAELNSERTEKGRVLEEHSKLRSYSEAREKEATELKSAFHRGGNGNGMTDRGSYQGQRDSSSLKTDSSNSSRRSSTTAPPDGNGKGKNRLRSVDFSDTRNI